MNLKFFVDVTHVEFDRVVAHTEFGRGRCVVVAFDEEFQKPKFVRGEVVVELLRRAYFAK